MANYWLKLYHKLLHDPDIAPLPDNIWRLWIECLLLAGESNEGGYLPTVSHMAFHLRRDETTLKHELQQLASLNLITWQDYNPFEQRWYIVNFARLQGPSPAAERMREMRARKKKEKEREITDTDTDTDSSVTPVTRALQNVTHSRLEQTTNPFWDIPKILETPDFLNAWKRWLDYADEAGLRFTETTATTVLNDLAGIGPDNAVRLIRQGIVRGWKSLNTDWLASITPTPAEVNISNSPAAAAAQAYARMKEEWNNGK